MANDNDKAFAVYKGTTEQFLITGDGKFYARAYRIKLGSFPDYVFKKDYLRMSIKDKWNFIQNNNHLPYLPEADKIIAEGLDIEEGLTGITRNVEELVLDVNDFYIELEKLKTEIKILKEENAELRNVISKE